MQNRKIDLVVLIGSTAALIGLLLFRKKLESIIKSRAKDLIASEGGISREATDAIVD